MECARGFLSNRKTLRSSRGANQTDDVHLCIMCLRAIMNYQVRSGAYPACIWAQGFADADVHVVSDGVRPGDETSSLP